MTTIAFDGKTLAADRRVSKGLSAVGTKTKIRRCLDGRLLGGCGDAGFLTYAFEAIEENGFVPMELSSKFENNWSILQIDPDGDVILFTGSGPVEIDRKGFHAMGSGEDFARAALYCGKTAREAIEVASAFDYGTGDGVDELELGPWIEQPKSAGKLSRLKDAVVGMFSRNKND